MKRRTIEQIILNRSIPVVNDQMLLTDVVSYMINNKLDSVLLKNKKDQVTGIFTDSDIKKAVHKEIDFKTTKVFSGATIDNLITINIHKTMCHAVHLMNEHNIRHLIAVDDEDRIVGLVTLKQIIESDFLDFEIELDFKHHLEKVL